jgi:hypothetical protein
MSSAISIRSFVRIGSAVSVYGVTRMGSSLSILDDISLGSAASCEATVAMVAVLAFSESLNGEVRCR